MECYGFPAQINRVRITVIIGLPLGLEAIARCDGILGLPLGLEAIARCNGFSMVFFIAHRRIIGDINTHVAAASPPGDGETIFRCRIS